MKEKLKILVVDDVEVIAKNMQSIIATNENVEKVYTAQDGEDAFMQILNYQPDIVFTDNQMPKRTGIELIKYVKDFPNLEKKPQFILITGDSGPELINAAREFEFYVEFKPIDNNKLHYYINNFDSTIETESTTKEKTYKKKSLFKKLLNK